MDSSSELLKCVKRIENAADLEASTIKVFEAEYASTINIDLLEGIYREIGGDCLNKKDEKDIQSELGVVTTGAFQNLVPRESKNGSFGKTGGDCLKMKNLEDGHSKCGVINNESTPNLASRVAEKSIFGRSEGEIQKVFLHLSS